MLFPRVLSPSLRVVALYVSIAILLLGLVVGIVQAMNEPTNEGEEIPKQEDSETHEGDVHQQIDIKTTGDAETHIEQEANTDNESEFESDLELEVDDEDLQIEEESENILDSESTNGDSSVKVSLVNGEYDIDVTGDGEVKKEVEQTEDSTKIHVEYKEETDNSSTRTSVKIKQSSR